jgi:repressor LexA
MKGADQVNKTLKFIKEFIAKNKYAPTVREICDGTGIESTATVKRKLLQLREHGFITFKDYLPRTIVVLDKDGK